MPGISLYPAPETTKSLVLLSQAINKRSCLFMGFPAETIIKNLPANADDTGLSLIPESGRSLGLGIGNLLQCSCLENSMAKGAYGLQFMGSESWTRLSD